jgi:predicted dienelactone hydrolase
LTIADPGGKPLAIGIWYPSDAAASPQPLAGIYTQTVARDSAMSGRLHPLVVISHGNNGSLASFHDTALALAQAGFVAAAVTHTGDNFQDQSYVANGMNLIDRPRQMRRLVDYMVKEWPSHDRIDADRIGIFGHSLGGFTALVAIGGIPDLTGVARLCKTKPDAPSLSRMAAISLFLSQGPPQPGHPIRESRPLSSPRLRLL